jgi:hypothetical protein
MMMHRYAANVAERRSIEEEKRLGFGRPALAPEDRL